MKKKRSIKRKITKLLALTVTASLLLIVSAGAYGLYSLKKISMGNSERLGQTAAEDAEEALEEMAGERLYELAVQRAALLEEKCKTLEAGAKDGEAYSSIVKNAVLDTQIGESGYAFLLNERGIITVSGAAEGETAAEAEKNGDLRESSNLPLAQAAADMIEGNSGMMCLMIDGREVYLAYTPLARYQWSFATVIEVEEVIAPAKEIEQTILMLTKETERQQDRAISKMLFGVLLTMLPIGCGIGILSVLFSERITEPIEKLTKEVAELDSGRPDVKLEIHTGDEVEELGNAFCHMAKKMREYIRNLERVTAEEERIRTELTVAARLQADMLPSSGSELADRKEFALWAKMVPAKEVGGDFYDFFLVDKTHLAMVVADVSGKGVPAALFMVVAKTLFRSHINRHNTLAGAVEKVNNSLCGNNKDGMFVTAWIGVLDLTNGRLVYVNAGHNAPLLKSAGREYEYIRERSGLVLAEMEHVSYRQFERYLKYGDELFLYTDGVTEAQDRNRELYGEERLLALLNRCKTDLPEETVGTVWRDVLLFQGSAEQFDDITELSLSYRGNGFKEKSGEPVMEQMKNFMDFVGETLEGYGIERETTAKLLAAFDELYSNICYYSHAAAVSIGAGITKYDGGTEAFLTFTDDGIAYNPLEEAEPETEADLESRQEGGLGIYLVKKRMDRVEYEYAGGKNRLRIYKKIQSGNGGRKET